MAPLVVTAYYNTHDSGYISVYIRFGLVVARGLIVSFVLDVARVSSAPIFFNTVYSCCFITVRKAFFNRAYTN